MSFFYVRLDVCLYVFVFDLMYISHTHHKHYTGMSVQDFFTTLPRCTAVFTSADGPEPRVRFKVLRQTKIGTRVKAKGLDHSPVTGVSPGVNAFLG